MVSGSFLAFACGTTLEVAEQAPEGWKGTHPNLIASDDNGCESSSVSEVDVDILAYKRAWARLPAKVYEVDPLVCPKCVSYLKPTRNILFSLTGTG